jgi:hypothetical protein
MVKRRIMELVIVALTFQVLLLPVTNTAHAEDITYRVDHEYAKIWINQDGTIDLNYTIKLTCLSGTIGGFYVGQPTGDFKIGEAYDINGNNLIVVDASSGDNYRVDVTLANRIVKGQTSEFTLLTNVGRMIFEDKTNTGNYGLQFTTSWFEDAEVIDLRIMIVFPLGAELEDVRNTPDWSTTPIHDPEENGRLTMYWERANIAVGQKFTVGVSFPSKLMTDFKPNGSSGWTSIMTLIAVVGGIAFFGVIMVILIVVIRRAKRKSYTSPQMQIEALGIKRGLTAVEAAQLIELPPQKVAVTMLYSLLMKKSVSVEGVEPNIKLKVLQNPQELRYYEIEFLKSINPDGILNEEKLAHTIMYLRDTVDYKLKGYCREDTIKYYKDIVEKAWKQVETAQTPELASNLFNENLLWLLMDGRYVDRAKETFTPIIFIPNPDWWWYSYNKRYLPTLGLPPTQQSSGTQSIPGTDFANSIATSLEQASSKLVSDIEKFTKNILPPPPQKIQSREPVHHKSKCVCACASCACACACVSCACACASGGAH